MTESLTNKLKKMGIRSVKKLADAEGVHRVTLHRWQKEQPELLQSAIERYLGSRK